ncbi:hypothetical protein EV426DRAFT_704491 [Tirmania nivea]|nr:hypothetical protein EV426DRAFT_704491 [Tirmania nivea]
MDTDTDDERPPYEKRKEMLDAVVTLTSVPNYLGTVREIEEWVYHLKSLADILALNEIGYFRWTSSDDEKAARHLERLRQTQPGTEAAAQTPPPPAMLTVRMQTGRETGTMTSAETQTMSRQQQLPVPRLPPPQRREAPTPATRKPVHPKTKTTQQLAPRQTPLKKQPAPQQVPTNAQAPSKPAPPTSPAHPTRAQTVVMHSAPTKYKPGQMRRWIEEDNRGVEVMGIRKSWGSGSHGDQVLLKQHGPGKVASSLVIYTTSAEDVSGLRMGSRLFRITKYDWNRPTSSGRRDGNGIQRATSPARSTTSTDTSESCRLCDGGEWRNRRCPVCGGGGPVYVLQYTLDLRISSGEGGNILIPNRGIQS